MVFVLLCLVLLPQLPSQPLESSRHSNIVTSAELASRVHPAAYFNSSPGMLYPAATVYHTATNLNPAAGPHPSYSGSDQSLASLRHQVAVPGHLHPSSHVSVTNQGTNLWPHQRKLGHTAEIQVS